MKKTIRPYRSEDCDAIVQLFRETVHSVNAKDYTKGLLDAWAPAQIDNARWNSVLSANFTIVVESEDGTIIGFGDIDSTGYFDHLFVHRDFQGQHVATSIANAIETFARKKSFERITVAASITAKPFFEKRGYRIIKEQQVERNGQVLTNYMMEFLM
ncbi:GNAT family N-acetyltransferase [Flavobacterium album]|uniref:GNAT family N-acetyltransferase n=1 Tax=Flavobacterium album TaxID=2175091 RepID=A0A2S1QUM5_9FLAO|nr:GNAT family N-acetyltransferase [Flavobacterium album]AWH83951.1 GNAT family N-acetyltransferase [Flavobacterium album]